MAIRKFKFVAVVLPLVLLATACATPDSNGGGASPTEQPPEGSPDSTAPSSPSPAAAELEDELLVGFYGGVIGEAFDEAFVQPCSESLGVDVSVEQDFDGPRLTKMQAGGSGIDVALFTDPIMPEVRAAGMTTPLPLEAIPNYESVSDEYKTDDSVAVSNAVWGIAYDAAAVDPAPTSWTDLLDPEYEGRVTASSITYNSTYLTLAAFQDIAGGDMVENREPGYELMKELRANSPTFWSSSSDMLQQLLSGAVVMSPYASGSTAISASDPGGENIQFVAPEEGAYPVGFNMVINPETDAPNAAAAFINCVLDADNQSVWIDLYPSFPANNDAEISDETLAWLGGVEDLSELVTVDWDAIHEVKDEIVSEWQRQIEE